MGGAPGGGHAAAGRAAALVAGFLGAADGGRFGAVAASDVEGDAVAPADDAELGVAG